MVLIAANLLTGVHGMIGDPKTVSKTGRGGDASTPNHRSGWQRVALTKPIKNREQKPGSANARARAATEDFSQWHHLCYNCGEFRSHVAENGFNMSHFCWRQPRGAASNASGDNL